MRSPSQSISASIGEFSCRFIACQRRRSRRVLKHPNVANPRFEERLAGGTAGNRQAEEAATRGMKCAGNFG
jgi:hypothetical protein